jgi:glyoxylase-like metal-dependent hydrolase (beta-lactamase superfamily II)
MLRPPAIAFALILAAVAPTALAQQDFSKTEIKTQVIAPGIAVLFGEGGNIAVSHGADGTVMIDDQYAPLTPKLTAAVAALGATPVKYLINTHWHGDHSGGNENFGKAGAVILAHDHVRDRMSTPQVRGTRTIGPSPALALPIITYHDGISLHLNGDRVWTVHMKHAHTDGDSVVFWEKANVVHMGDTFFLIGGFPFVDLNSGGTVKGLRDGIGKILRMIDDKTVVIPGHGPVTTKAELATYYAMLVSMIDAVETSKKAGKSLAEIQAMKPGARWDTSADAYIRGDAFVETIFKSLDLPEHHRGEGTPMEHGGGEHKH